jgi:hypothetical protein
MKKLVVLMLLLLLLAGCATPPRIGVSLQVRKTSPAAGFVTLRVKNQEERPTTPILVEVSLKPSDGSAPLRPIHPAAFVLNRQEEREIVAPFRSNAASFEPVLVMREAETGRLLAPEPLRTTRDPATPRRPGK